MSLKACLLRQSSNALDSLKHVTCVLCVCLCRSLSLLSLARVET